MFDIDLRYQTFGLISITSQITLRDQTNALMKETTMITEKQFYQRKNSIGASDSPIIMGFSNYKTPYELYLEKIGAVEMNYEPPTNGPQYWGGLLEEVIAREFTKRSGHGVIFPDTITSDEHVFMSANLDGFVPTLNAALELKYSGWYQEKLWGESGTDGIPMQYLIQVAHQCIVANADVGILCVLLNGSEYRQYEYRRDNELEQCIIDACTEFWEGVQAQQPPSPITIDDCRLKFKRSNESSIKADAILRNMVSDICVAKEKIKAIEEEIGERTMGIMEHMMHHETLVDEQDNVLVTWKANKRGTRVFSIRSAKD